MFSNWVQSNTMSSKLTLYFAPASPPARATLLLARNLDLDINVKVVNLAKKEQYSEEFIKLNPLHLVPVLVDGDFVLTESRAIMAYLVKTRKPESSLYPSDPKKQALIDSRLYYCAANVHARLSAIVRPIIYKGAKTIAEPLRDSLYEMLKVIDGFLSNSKYVAGNEMTIADISILPTITSISEFGADFSPYPQLNAWFSEMKSLPGFDENLKGAQNHVALVRSRVEGVTL